MIIHMILMWIHGDILEEKMGFSSRVPMDLSTEMG